MTPARFSQGIEKVIWLAALDEAFRGRLLTDRAAALASSGVELTDAEHAILLSISEEQLKGAIAKTEVPLPARRAFLRGAASAALAVLGSFFLLPESGCREKKKYIDVSTFGLTTGTGTAGISPTRIDDPGSYWLEFGYRSCYVNIPASYERSVGAPALVFYHGESQDAQAVHGIWNTLSESEGFILICPTWAGTADRVMTDGGTVGEEEMAALLFNDLVYCTIPNFTDDRLYAGGFGTGAQVALATALTDTDYPTPGKYWAAIASWAGILPGTIDPALAPRTDLPVYLAAGDADSVVPAADVQALQAQLDGIGFQTNYAGFSGAHDIGIYDPQAAWDWISPFTNP